VIQHIALALLALASLVPTINQAEPAAGTPPTALAGRPGGPSWSELSPATQAALSPLRQHWGGIDALRKSKWIVVAQRFASLPPAEQMRVQQRMDQWASMTPAERGRARLYFQELRDLPQDDRQARWQAYRALPDEQKRELARRARPVARAPEVAASTSPGKRRVAVNPASVAVKPVSPTVVQAKPGVSTTLMTKPPSPPVHHQPGLPKIMATEGFVNPSTLLPSRGPQGAATRSTPAASAIAPKQ
jgi:hypothetical protein